VVRLLGAELSVAALARAGLQAASRRGRMEGRAATES
jgi:hypothetical protein